MIKQIAACAGAMFLAVTLAAHAATPEELLQGCRNLGGLRSVSGNQKVAVNFVNRTIGNVKIIWINYNGNKILYGTLAPNQNWNQVTYVTHPWLILNSSNDCLGAFVASKNEEVNIK
jgi:hypothetical protein